MGKQAKSMRSDIGWSTAERIMVKGFDLPGELLGKVDLGDMAFLEMMDRLPTPQESMVFNALLVALVEHGITPSALATRLTYLGAPESLQSAVAAGLLGLGSMFVGTIEGSARMLQEAWPKPAKADVNPESVAGGIVAKFTGEKSIIPGLGHPIHKTGDPRTPRLFEIAAKNGFDGPYIELMQHIQRQAERHYARRLPLNATGAVGAIASELGIPWQICRGLGLTICVSSI